MEEEASNVNIEALEKVSKKITRRERRDRKKKKRIGVEEIQNENGEDNGEEKNEEESQENGEGETNTTPRIKKNSKLGNSGGRVFASNPVLYKNRKERSKLKESKEKNINEEEEKSNDSSENSPEIERLKLELEKAIEEKNISQIPIFMQQFKELIGDNLNFRFSDGLTLIHKAIQKRSTELMRVLIENGAVIHLPSITGVSPLHFAAQLGDLPSVDYLISKNANPMQRDIENKSCLHSAVLGGNMDCLELIAKQPGVLINHRDNSGCSALHYAVKKESKEMVDFLLGKGADPLLLDQLGSRPIDYIPGYSRYLPSKNIKLSPQGKKVFKVLKKKGGHRLPAAVAKSDLVMGGGLVSRSRSLDHRNPVISQDFAKNLQSKGININIPSHFQSAPPPAEKKIETKVKEKDLELLYYNPTQKVAEEQPIQPVSQTPVKKTDKYGFYTSNSESSSLKHSKIVKEEKMALKWLEVIKNWDETRSKKIQKYCDKGIPDSVRGMVWKLLAGCEMEEGVDYEELLQRDSIPKVKEQILKDITRTMPNHILFQEKGQGQQMLTNVLTAYSVYKPSVGYCQGMGFITAMFLMYMPEEDAFWMLNRIADEYRFARLWDEHMALVTECMYALGVLMQQNLPDIQAKLDEDNIPPISYVPQFFITGFLYSLPFPMVVRIWDCFLLRKFDYLYAVAIALFKVSKDKVMKMKMEQVMVFLRFKDSGEELDFTVDQLLKTAIAIWSKFSSSQIRKLEEEGGKIRAEEKERMLAERNNN